MISFRIFLIALLVFIGLPSVVRLGILGIRHRRGERQHRRGRRRSHLAFASVRGLCGECGGGRRGGEVRLGVTADSEDGGIRAGNEGGARGGGAKGREDDKAGGKDNHSGMEVERAGKMLR